MNVMPVNLGPRPLWLVPEHFFAAVHSLSARPSGGPDLDGVGLIPGHHPVYVQSPSSPLCPGSPLAQRGKRMDICECMDGPSHACSHACTFNTLNTHKHPKREPTI